MGQPQLPNVPAIAPSFVTQEEQLNQMAAATIAANQQDAVANHQAVMQRLNSIETTIALQPMRIFNSTTGPGMPLLDQNLAQLQAPHPLTRDQLLNFTANECCASAAAFGLPDLPGGNNVPVDDRRRQLARYLGVPLL